LTTGPRAEQFENEFKQYVGAPYALAVNSGTAALHLPLAALKIGPGDEVITTPLTFCATANTILQVGAKPVLADIGEDGNIDPHAVASRITGQTRALIPVHLGGLACEMQALWSLARQYGLFVIEDAAHATGSHYKGLPIGAHCDEDRSDAVAYSFYATKNLTTGEGGMVTTHDAVLTDRMKVLCLHGISKDAWNRYTEHGNWFYEVVACGFKYNLSDLQAALGIHQLRKQEQFLEARSSYAAFYDEAFRDLPELELPPRRSDSRHSWHLYALRLNLDKLSINRDEFIVELRRHGIGASVHFIPLPLHPFFAQLDKETHAACPRALELYPRLVSLPLYPALTQDEVGRVTESVRTVIRGARTTRPFYFHAEPEKALHG
jgi:dTDP-4-amino-4,6-dideoxygalactose transaminase